MKLKVLRLFSLLLAGMALMPAQAQQINEHGS